MYLQWLQCEGAMRGRAKRMASEVGTGDGALSSRASGALMEISTNRGGVAFEPSMARLITELHGAAAEASMDGFYRMARLLDECSLTLDSHVPRNRSERLTDVERARQALELWWALREW